MFFTPEQLKRPYGALKRLISYVSYIFTQNIDKTITIPMYDEFSYMIDTSNNQNKLFDNLDIFYHFGNYNSIKCNTENAEQFFVDKHKKSEETKRICNSCPAQIKCLEYALDQRIQFGIFGGLSIRDRLKYKTFENLAYTNGLNFLPIFLVKKQKDICINKKFVQSKNLLVFAQINAIQRGYIIKNSDLDNYQIIKGEHKYSFNDNYYLVPYKEIIRKSFINNKGKITRRRQQKKHARINGTRYLIHPISLKQTKSGH
jgi:hypothetical protein